MIFFQSLIVGFSSNLIFLFNLFIGFYLYPSRSPDDMADKNRKKPEKYCRKEKRRLIQAILKLVLI